MGTTLLVLVAAIALASLGELVALPAAWFYPVLLGVLIPLLVAVAFVGYVDVGEQRAGTGGAEAG
jgi:hypothetical protein